MLIPQVIFSRRLAKNEMKAIDLTKANHGLEDLRRFRRGQPPIEGVERLLLVIDKKEVGQV